MRRLKLLGLALLAVFASAAALSSSALALELPENLPVSESTRTFTGKNEGETEFKTVGIAPVKCTEVTGEGSEEAKKPLGTVHFDFKNCTTEESGLKVKCTGLGETTSGTILVLGTWHLVFDRKKGGTFAELTTGPLFLISLVHFSCSSLILVEVHGEQLCLHLKATEKSTTHSFHCVVAGTTENEQSEEWCKKDVAGACTEPVVPRLRASVNHAAEVESAELALGNSKYAVEIFADI